MSSSVNNVNRKFLDPPGNSPEPCDTEKEEPCLNNISPTGGETEKEVYEKGGKPADIKHEDKTCRDEETSGHDFEIIEELEYTKELPSPGPSAPSVQPQNESQPASSYLGELWPKVKIFPFPTGQTFGAHEAILEKVKINKNYGLISWLISWLFSWPTPTVEEKQSPEESSVVIVFCPITSRVGSDVESAMTNPKVSSLDKPVILVLMHHTRDPDYSTGETKWSEVYDNITLDVHVLFHETVPGLLTCQQNDQAIEAIEKKLYDFIIWPLSNLSKSNHTPS